MGIGPLNRIDLVALPAEAPWQSQMPRAARDLVKAVSELNQTEFASSDRQLTFTWDSSSSQPVIRIVKRDTGEVIEEIPAEAVRRMMDDLRKSNK
jgi:uncharacterized FlaG/YvyC family protein